MARYPYISYGSSRKRKRQNRLYFLLAIIVIIAGVIILRRSASKDQTAPSVVEEPDTATSAAGTEPEPEDKFEPVEVKPGPVEPEPEDEGTDISGGETTSPEVVALIEEAQRDIISGNIIAGRDKLIQSLPMDLSPAVLTTVKSQLARLSKKWLFSKDYIPGDTLTGWYEVRADEILEKIGKNHKVPWEILKTINNIHDPKLLQAGQKIKIIYGPFHAIIYRSTFTMDLYLGNKTYVKTYGVGLGEVDLDTPTGQWRVGEKLIEPPWPKPEGGYAHPGDADYPLGSRWIALDGIKGEAKSRTGIGIHGTKEAETIGNRSSQGCIRLYNGEVIELYDLLMPGLSEIYIQD